MNKDDQRALDAGDDWREWGKQFGWTLYGWNYEDSASFVRTEKPTPWLIEMPKWIRDDIDEVLRQARGDIAGEVCPHWTVAVAQFANSGFAIAAQKLEDDHYFGDSSKFSALRDEIDMLIEQAEAKT